MTDSQGVQRPLAAILLTALSDLLLNMLTTLRLLCGKLAPPVEASLGVRVALIKNLLQVVVVPVNVIIKVDLSIFRHDNGGIDD